MLSLFAVALFSCSKESESISPADTEESYPGGIETNNGISANATASLINKSLLLQLVNDARAKGCNCGTTYMPPAPPVIWNDLLEQAAYNHSNDMYTKNYFSHYGLDGSTPATRVTAVGYRWRALGENLAKGYLNESSVIAGWLKSPGHCRNIMNPKFKDMGVSKVGSYWTQELALKY